MVMKLDQVVAFGRSFDEYQKEILRISREVRIFPLLTLMQKTSSHLDFIVNQFSELGYSVAIKEVPYELQPGGNKMLIIKQI